MSDRFILIKVSSCQRELPSDTSIVTAFTTTDSLPPLLTTLISQTPQFSTIVTSQQALHSLALQSTTLDAIKHHPLFVIGHASYTLAHDVGFTCIYGRDSRTALELMDTVRSSEEWTNCTPFIFLCGDKRLQTVQHAFSTESRDLSVFEVYKTQPDPSLAASLTQAIDAVSTHLIYIVFYSPSIVTLALPILRQILQDRPSIAYKIASIGPTTSAALNQAGITVDLEAPEPSLASLKSCIQS